MLVCNSCNHTFLEEDAEIRAEYMGECFGSPAHQNYSVCPLCGSDDVKEAEQCELCESCENVKNYEGSCYCNDCVSKAKHKFSELLNKNFTEKEKRLIYWCIDVDTWVKSDENE